MCYYNGQKVTRAEKIRLLHLEKTLAEYNFLNRVVIDGFDYGDHAILKPQQGKEDFDIIKSEWGVIPTWLKTRADVNHFRRGGTNPDTGKYDKPITTLNAIGEEVLEKTMYKKAAREQRCIIISSGFYEWRHIYPIGKKGQPLKTAIKYPYYISLPDKEYFYMAGIWSPWVDKETNEYVETSAIMTAPANELMAQVHNAKKRMPTILTEELAYEWMFGKLDDKRIIEIATTQHPYEEMYAYSLDKDFLNSIDPTKRANHPDLPPIPLPKYLNEAEHMIIDDGDLKQGRLFG